MASSSVVQRKKFSSRFARRHRTIALWECTTRRMSWKFSKSGGNCLSTLSTCSILIELFKDSRLLENVEIRHKFVSKMSLCKLPKVAESRVPSSIASSLLFTVRVLSLYRKFTPREFELKINQINSLQNRSETTHRPQCELVSWSLSISH